MMRLASALIAPALLAGPAQAAATGYRCERSDAPETLYLKIDDSSKGALVVDDAKELSAAALPADEFTPVSVSFKQFVKYSFDRIALTLEKRSIGATGKFKCERMASP